jgi:hypothetical protein
MASATVRIRGLRELNRSLNKINKEAARTVRNAIKEAAEPVAAAARSKLSRFQGASVGTIAPRASVKGAFVTQRARKVTGLRPDFGRLQMTEVLVPALEEHRDEVLDRVEDALDRLGREAGF